MLKIKDSLNEKNSLKSILFRNETILKDRSKILSKLLNEFSFNYSKMVKK